MGSNWIVDFPVSSRTQIDMGSPKYPRIYNDVVIASAMAYTTRTGMREYRIFRRSEIFRRGVMA